MGKIEEKRIVPVFCYESNGLPGVTFGQSRLIDRVFDHLLSPIEFQGRHVIAVQNAKEFIKSLVHRRPFQPAAQMPFAEQRAAIAHRFQAFSDRDFFKCEVNIVGGPCHIRHQIQPDRVASGEQATAGSGTDISA